MKTKKIVGLLLLAALGVFLMAGCSRESDKVSYNVSQDADNFNVVRRVVVTNVRTDEIMFEVVGRISLDTSNSEKLVIIAETGDGVYKKHFVNMTEWNMYVVEDLEGAEVNQYKYEVNYMPESIVPFTFTNKD